MKTMMTVQEASERITAGAKLLIAGDEKLLSALPNGDWIGGTIPYFMSEEGGLSTSEKLQVTALPPEVLAVRAKFYSADQLPTLPADYDPNGFCYIVIPAFTKAHHVFAKDCSTWPDVFDRPLVGWIAGVDLGDLGKVKPKVFNGATGESSEEMAVTLHVELPESMYARANIINLFSAGSGDTLTFPEVGFEVTDCYVNGVRKNLAAYLVEKDIDTKQPLVANYSGAMINVSLQNVDAAAGKVALYAPVFPGVEYKVAARMGEYEAEFNKQLENGSLKDRQPVFSCNCILNYLYARLEGKKTGHVVGPITFGEIAYMLLNQTLVYLTFENK